MQNIQKQNQHEKGFTLVELLLASAILALIIGSVFFVGKFLQENVVAGFNKSEGIDTLYYALTTITSQLREMQTGESGEYPLEQADDNAITFYADIDGDGLIERVRYYEVGSTLYQGVIQPTMAGGSYDPATESTKIMASSVVNTAAVPLFFYYNDSWPLDTTNNPLPSTSRILESREIAVWLYISNDQSPRPEIINASSAATLRSLKSNW